MAENRNTYYCPACSASLSIGNNVVLTVKKENGEGGIIFLDSRLGGYTKVKHSSLLFEEGERVFLHCPVCCKDLLCIPDYNLARLMMKDENEEYLTVLFSVIYGKEITLVIKDKTVLKKYGKHHDEINFENLSFCK